MLGFALMFLLVIFIELLQKEKLVVHSLVYIYAMGMSQAFFKPRELRVLKQWDAQILSHLECTKDRLQWAQKSDEIHQYLTVALVLYNDCLNIPNKLTVIN